MGLFLKITPILTFINISPNPQQTTQEPQLLSQAMQFK